MKTTEKNIYAEEVRISVAEFQSWRESVYNMVLMIRDTLNTCEEREIVEKFGARVFNSFTLAATNYGVNDSEFLEEACPGRMSVFRCVATHENYDILMALTAGAMTCILRTYPVTSQSLLKDVTAAVFATILKHAQTVEEIVDTDVGGKPRNPAGMN